MSKSWNLYLRNLSAHMQLLLKGKRGAIGIDVMSVGEIQFFRDVLIRLVECDPSLLIFLIHHTVTGAQEFAAHIPGFKHPVVHLSNSALANRFLRRLDLFITTEQFVCGPPTVYTLTIFHGQPAKGITFKLHNLEPLRLNDALFLYGPLHRQALKEYLDYWNQSLPAHLSLFDIGYTKSDKLINGQFDRERVLRVMGLDPEKKTIIYAPAFDEGASMRENGKEILSTLCALDQYNVIAKLAIDCLNLDLVGGINWYDEIAALETQYSNFRLMRSLEIDPGLAASDVLITCVSSVGFEFLALKKPVIYFDTPKFFRETLSKVFPDRDLSLWGNRTAVNGGREYGLVVSCSKDLPAAIDEVLAHRDKYPKRQWELPHCLIYNPGKAVEAAVKQIQSLLTQRVRSQRPYAHDSFWIRARAKVRRSLQGLKAAAFHGSGAK